MPNSPTPQTLFLYSTTVSDVGTVRSNNQDSSFAGEHLVAICDGMGGHAGGDTASTIAIRSLAHIEQDDTGGDIAAIARMMETSVMAAHDAIVGKAKRERKLAGMGTTVTAVALVNGHWVLSHIGDSRAYLLRDGKLRRMTADHSYVQHLIDTGRITEAEARNHPQRNVVMRVLGDFDIDPRPDIAILDARPADRWLLCSDGLCGVLEDETIASMMTQLSDQEECAQTLVSMALKAGSTDNVTAVIADSTLALDADAFDLPHQTPLVGGAASASLEPIADIVNEPVASAPSLRSDGSPAQRAAALAQEAAQVAEEEGAQARIAQPSAVREEAGERDNPDTGEIPVVQKSDGRLSADPNDPDVAQAIHHEKIRKRKSDHARTRRRRVLAVVIVLAVLAALAGAGWGAWRWSQTKYYLTESNGAVTIWQGVPTDLFGIDLSHEVERTSIKTARLPQSWRDQLAEGITVDNYDEAIRHANLIRRELKKNLERQQKEEADKSGKADAGKTGSDESKQSKPSSTDASDKDADKATDAPDKDGEGR